ncbi:MAG: HD domain-containing protein, partial [Proteobacteria bacterium]|nr:HD domain-containing protein [Pseudomonadota bacterium]
LDADYRFVLKARTALHLSAGRKTDTLHFDLQPRVAELLGYANKNADPLARGMAVEHFLSDLHKAMARIKMLRAVFWQECFPPRFWRTRKLSPAVEDTAVGLGFILSGPVRPAEMLELFAQAAATGRPLSLAANRAIREAISTGIDTFEGSAETLAALLDVFRAPFGLHAALTMVDTGLMAALLPRFSEVEHLVQFDDYHVHPVGRHTVETVGRVADLLSGRDERFRDLAANVAHPDRLLLAALFHDLGKGGPNHSAIGAELVRETLAGFGLDKATVRDAAFLVEHHLLIPKTATRGDLSDERVVAGVAEIAETLERLDMLYLLSVADSMATGPRAWSAWTGSLFQELYRKARNLLTSGPLSEPEVAQAARATRERARVEACGSLDEAYVNDCLAKMPPRAFQALGPLDLVRHMTLVRQLQVALDEDAVRMPGKNKGVGISAIEARKTGVGNTFEVSIATQDRPGLFATLAGVLALHQLDILAADLFTWKDGTVVDVFIVEGPGDNLFPEEVFERVRRAIRYAFLGKLSLGYRLDEMRKSPLYRSGSGPKLPPVVRVNNQASDFHTLIEVAASDCLGLLYDIALTLANMYVSIHLAKITTDAGRIADVFYVLASDGRKLDDPGLVRQVEAELLKVVKHS